VIDLHGWGEPRDMHAFSTGFGTLGETEGFVTVTPTLDRNVVRWQPWLASDDVAWFAALLDELDAALCIDSTRVFVAGFSNGAMMASVLACEMPDRIAAIAPVAGVRRPEGCTTGRPVPVIAFHGTDDRVLAYDGGYGPDAVNLANPYGEGALGERISEVGYTDMSVADAMAAWADGNSCAAASTSTAGAASVTTWECPPAAATVLYTIEGGGHGWTASDPATTQLIWAFFEQHPLTA
jgi:polyhydroxybutyrate depolymerase